MKSTRLIAQAAVLLLATVAPSQATSNSAAATGGTERKDDVPVLPTSMVPVNGGSVRLGRTAKELLEMLQDLYFTDQQRVRDVRRLMSELGPKTEKVDPFLLGKYPVTMKQYKIFVEKTGHRFPFDWWRYGKEEDYQSRLKQINEEISKDVDNRPLAFWQQNWKDLPWAIPTAALGRGRTESKEDYPVVYVSWEDALAFAAWAGMRMPTEAEWTYAAVGDTDKEFLWGESFKEVTVNGVKYKKEGSTATLDQATAGPFGHFGMVRGVWEWTGERGFFSHDEPSKFKSERTRLLKDKLFRKTEDQDVAAAVKFTPTWRGDKVVCKGGMYASTPKSDLRVQTRAPIESIQTLAGVGFRLAKSQKPAIDMAQSLIKIDYDISILGDRKPNFADAAGIERYELSKDGELILGYHALAFVPLNMVTDDRKMTLKKLQTASVEDNKPVLLGTFITSVPTVSPKLDPGVYTLCYRHNGTPKKLKGAISDAKKYLKAKAKAEKAGKDAPKDDGEWAKVLRRYGITEEMVLSDDEMNFVVLGGVRVPMADKSLLLRDKDGKYIAAFKAPGSLLKRKGKYEDGNATIATGKAKKGDGETITFDFGVPTGPKSRGNAYGMTFTVELAKENAGGANWRR